MNGLKDTVAGFAEESVVFNVGRGKEAKCVRADDEIGNASNPTTYAA